MKEREREFYLQLLHSSLCWRWGGKRKRERDGDEETGGEPGSSFKIETSSENKHTNVRRQQ